MSKKKQIALNILIVIIMIIAVVPIYAVVHLLNWMFDELEYYSQKVLDMLCDIRDWLSVKIKW